MSLILAGLSASFSPRSLPLLGHPRRATSLARLVDDFRDLADSIRAEGFGAGLQVNPLLWPILLTSLFQPQAVQWRSKNNEEQKEENNSCKGYMGVARIQGIV